MSARRDALRRFALALLAGALTVVLLWGAGFAWFLHTALAEAPPPPAADGIVALTGGAGRVELALRLLADGRARLLLVSGVGGDAGFGDLARLAGVDSHLKARVTLGRAAASTHGNAAETAEWAQTNTLHSLIVVTASYHMPRALAELGRSLPGVVLYPAPVQPASLRNGLREGNQAAVLRLLASEYTKFLAAEAGLSALIPARPGGTERHG